LTPPGSITQTDATSIDQDRSAVEFCWHRCVSPAVEQAVAAEATAIVQECDAGRVVITPGARTGACGYPVVTRDGMSSAWVSTGRPSPGRPRGGGEPAPAREQAA
jgi:hypothetical protein